jgi:hypothetical protein
VLEAIEKYFTDGWPDEGDVEAIWHLVRKGLGRVDVAQALDERCGEDFQVYGNSCYRPKGHDGPHAATPAQLERSLLVDARLARERAEALDERERTQ